MCPQGLSDRLEDPEQRIWKGFLASPHTREVGEVRSLAVPPGPGQTSTEPYSSGPPCGRSGKPGSAVPTPLSALPLRWATPPQCTGQSFPLQGPPSPTALEAVPAQSGHPGSASASPGPIPGRRNAGPGASCSCCQIHWYSLILVVLTSRG